MGIGGTHDSPCIDEEILYTKQLFDADIRAGELIIDVMMKFDAFSFSWTLLLSLCLPISGAMAQEAGEAAETEEALPATVITSDPSTSAPIRSYTPPVQHSRPAVPVLPAVTPETKPLILDDFLPKVSMDSANSTFLPPSGLEVLGVREPQDVVRYAANQSATDSGSRSFGDVYSVRGLTNTIFFGAPSTTIYVDDVPFGETFTYSQNLGPINAVEVLRGPQPTLVGRNVYGGLINVTTRRPSDTLEGSLNYNYGSFDRHGVDAWVMSPLGENASFRLDGGWDTHEGYMTNPLTGKKVDSQESYHFDGAFYFDIAPDWELGIVAGYSRQKDGAPRLTSLNRTTGFYTVASDITGEQARDSNYQAIRLAHENDKFKFLSVTSHRGFELDPYTIDLDFTPLPIGFTTLSQTQELWSQEFRFSDNDPDAVWGWNAGVYGSKSRIHGQGLRGLSLPDSQTMNTVTPVPAGAPPFGLPFPSEIHSSTQLDTLASLQQLTVHTIDEDSFALYGGVENRAIENVTLRAGARLDWIKRSIVRDKSQTGDATTVATTKSTLEPLGVALPDDVRTVVTPLDTVWPRMKMQEEWTHVTPNLGIDWKLAEDHLVYANTTYAFKPGGFSAYSDNPLYVPFDKETAWTSELGLRSNWLDGKIKTNVAGFYSRVDGYQVERSFTVTDFTVFNADDAEIYGMEFETTVEISPTLDFLGSIGWTHARLTNYIDPVTGQDLSGATAPFVPEFDAVVALDYHLENGFFARIEMLALGNTKFDDFNRSQFQQSAYVLLNSAVGFRKNNWTAALYGSNLTQKEYYTNMNPEISTGAVGIPREFGVRVGYEF